MKKNIATIKIVKEQNYEVDIDSLSDDLAESIDEALYFQLDSDECDDILENEMRRLALLDAVGQVWHNEFLKKIVDNKITLDKEIWG